MPADASGPGAGHRGAEEAFDWLMRTSPRCNEELGATTSPAGTRPKKILTLVSLRHPERGVLLGMKKRGFGAGKWNGFGGKVDPSDTTVESSAYREVLEECGIDLAAFVKADAPAAVSSAAAVGAATPARRLHVLRHVGLNVYRYRTIDVPMEVHVFEAWLSDAAASSFVESEEMLPRWFPLEEVPLTEMWADDRYWLLQFLHGELQTPFLGRFDFQGHQGADSEIILEHSLGPLDYQAYAAECEASYAQFAERS